MGYGNNPYESPHANPYSSHGIAATSAASERATFIRQTYLHLALAMLGFVLLEALIFTVVPAETLRGLMHIAGGYTWLGVLVVFMVVSWVARSWAESSTSRSMQYVGLALYVVAQALLFVPLLTIAKFYTHDPYLIPSAGAITLVMFAGLTAVVFFTGADFSFLRMYLCWGGILAIGLIVCGVVFGLSIGVWFSVALVALASGYILYDTSNILHHYRTDQYVAASLALFASVALLLWYVLRILISLQGRD